MSIDPASSCYSHRCSKKKLTQDLSCPILPITVENNIFLFHKKSYLLSSQQNTVYIISQLNTSHFFFFFNVKTMNCEQSEYKEIFYLICLHFISILCDIYCGLFVRINTGSNVILEQGTFNRISYLGIKNRHILFSSFIFFLVLYGHSDLLHASIKFLHPFWSIASFNRFESTTSKISFFTLLICWWLVIFDEIFLLVAFLRDFLLRCF